LHSRGWRDHCSNGSREWAFDRQNDPNPRKVLVVLLERLVTAISPHLVVVPTNIEITNICLDSREAKAGTLFVAVPTVGGDAKSGGYQFIREAIERGAAAVVSEVDEDFGGVSTIHVNNARQVLADISVKFYGHPSRALELYAITGTDGKTTTSYFLEQIFARAGKRTGLLGTVESKIGDRRETNDERMTTPESPEVQRLLRQMVDAGVTHAVLEASSHALALDRLRGCEFKACALTNITRDHVEFHGSREAYFEAKASLFTKLAPGRPAILNRDEEHFEEIAGRVTGPVLGYGEHPEAELRATAVREEKKGSHFRIEFRGETADAKLLLPGSFNVSNALAAAGMALTAGLPLETVASALQNVKAPDGRFQMVKEGQPFEVVIDYAHTVHAFDSMLKTLRERNGGGGRLILVFGAAGDRDRAKRPELARIAEKYADYFVITNEDPYGEEPQAIIDEIASGVSIKEGSGFRCEADRARAIEMALGLAQAGDTVAILGKGHEKSIVRNGSKEPWSDISAVRESLKRLA
jgi:UDP-N-acetylmuramoyl-L-alanyl-D-glutamate--2,6-diaminopimelate ligase